MKKLTLLGIVLAMSTGCGHGLLPGIFRGDRCGSACGLSLPAPVNSGACTDCGTTSAGYGSYEGEVLGGEYYGGEVLGSTVGGSYYDGQVVGDNYYSGGYDIPAGGQIIGGGTIAPPMSDIVSPAS